MTVPDGTQADNAFGGPPLPQTHTPPGFPTSYLQLSDLRIGSKRKRASSSLSARPSLQNDRDIGSQDAQGFERRLAEPTACASQDMCVDCVVDCDDADCPVSSEEQCTDQCIVVPCNEQNACSDVCIEEACQVKHCDGGDECIGTLDETLQLLCCTDYHGYSASNSSQINWDCPLDDILGLTTSQSNFLGHSQFSEFNPQIGSIPSNMTLSGIPYNTSILPAAFQENSTSGSLLATPSQTDFSPASSQSVPQQTPSNDFMCRWLGCDASFNSLNELVGHVNLTHLRPSSSPPRPTKRLCLDSAAPDIFPLSCHWDDCHIYPDASTLPGPSIGLQPEMAVDFLSNHFIHDHLGLSVPPPQAPSVFHDTGYSSGELHENVKFSMTQDVVPGDSEQVTPTVLTSSQPSNSSSENTQTSQMVVPSYATPEPSPPPITTPSEANHSHDCATSTHVCHWEACGASFDSCTALTDHLAVAHVGSGKSRYDCHWRDCARSGAQGFTSKQKIMRHLQAHTGHRPFTCAECGQHFFEAATLQQHMRRHTQEKPFVCDFPGCGKAFTITGALTIHKRTHNGERPFQCPHCERAFAESSNLSKHLRTHNGYRPYHCTEPGCGKAFARPDQLQRHGNVHTKKRAVGAASAESITAQ